MTWRLDAKTKKKYEAAASLKLTERLRESGWAGLSAKETGQIGARLRSRKPTQE